MSEPDSGREQVLAVPDPEQLPLGMFEGVPIVPMEILGPDDEVVVIPVREPPTCGEWSYDDQELEEPRFVARRIDGIEAPNSRATPIHPIRTVSAPRGASTPRRERISGATTAPAPAAAAPAPSVTVPEPVQPTRSNRPTVEALRLAFEQTPADTTRALAYITALEKRADADVALRAIDAAQAAGADLFLLTCARASVLGAKLRYDDAEKAIKAAGKMRPDAREVLLQQGILSCRRGRWKEAAEPLQRAAALAPDDAVAHFYVGEVLNHTDKLPGALAAFERAAELEPDNWRALKGVGIVLDRLGRSSEAAPFYRRSRDAQRA